MSKVAIVKNAADTKQIKEGAAKVDEARHAQLHDLKVVMQTQAGRNLIWRILHEFCHIELRSASMRSGSETYFHEGARDVGIKLKDAIEEAAFSEYQEMEREWVALKLGTTEGKE